MTARKLDEIGANVASSSPLVLRVEQPIFCANNVSTPDRGKLGQREWRGEYVRRLRSKAIEGSCHCLLIAVVIEQLSGHVEVNPLQSQLLVRLTESLVPVWICHVGLLPTLVIEAASGDWNRGAQINQMANRSPSRDQRTYRPSQRMSYDHDVVFALIKGSANHVGVRVERRRRPVITRQIRRDYVMASPLQERSQPFPTPCAVPRSVHQRERRHAARVGTVTAAMCEDGTSLPVVWDDRLPTHPRTQRAQDPRPDLQARPVETRTTRPPARCTAVEKLSRRYGKRFRGTWHNGRHHDDVETRQMAPRALGDAGIVVWRRLTREFEFNSAELSILHQLARRSTR
ncbi:MAG: hypothetical protein QOE04_2301 [Mycobacterium sp.]|jgi:hypothetical protein|nr:hypothetical protein [Mycobacterium sp.]